jgi:hypothetical protein
MMCGERKRIGGSIRRDKRRGNHGADFQRETRRVIVAFLRITFESI